jgi:signal transduction histidine kinase
MRNKLKTRLSFVVDQDLILEGQSHLIEEVLKKDKVKIVSKDSEFVESNLNVIFTTIKKIKKNNWPKNKIFICNGGDNIDGPSIIKCDFMSYAEIENVVDKIFEAEKKSAISSILKDSEKIYEKFKEENETKNDLEIKSNLKEYDLLLDLEISLLKLEKISEWNPVFKIFVKKTNWLSGLAVLRMDDLFSEEDLLDENVLVFKFPFEDFFLFIKLRNNSLFEFSVRIEILVNLLLKSIQLLDQNLIRTDDEIDFWKRIFAKIPYPMAVITKLGDLLVYNELFAKIGILPKECLTYKDQESIEVHQQYYMVKKIEIDLSGQKVFYFVFYTTEKIQLNKTEKSNSVDDLGIVSSSIAHELNNPLAGILAALSLISLEENWSDESLSEIDDMKNGAKRCKELVEIFLGFSRFSPNQKYQTSLKDSLDQAIYLLRFRMVESNLRIDIKFTATLEKFSPNINSSILSMILYLIINELLTAFAHYRLVTQKNLNSMIGEVLELSNQIVIKLDDDFEYEEKLVQSKLIQHLLMFEKMEINFLRKEIRLIYRADNYKKF